MKKAKEISELLHNLPGGRGPALDKDVDEEVEGGQAVVRQEEGGQHALGPQGHPLRRQEQAETRHRVSLGIRQS